MLHKYDIQRCYFQFCNYKGPIQVFNAVIYFNAHCVCVCVQDEDLDLTLATDFEIGHFFRERVIPRAVLYFTGEALEDDESVRRLFLLLLSQGNLGLTID